MNVTIACWPEQIVSDGVLAVTFTMIVSIKKLPVAVHCPSVKLIVYAPAHSADRFCVAGALGLVKV